MNDLSFQKIDQNIRDRKRLHFKFLDHVKI